MVESIRYAGDVVVGEAIIKHASGSLLITDIIDEINVYESILTNTLSVTIDITDTNNILSNFTIIGGETVELNYHTPTMDNVNLTMVIYSIDNESLDVNRRKSFTINLCSPELLDNESIRISSSYTGNISSIIKQCFSRFDSASITDISRTDGIHKYIIPNWKPFRAINWLSERAKVDRNVDFLFYETVDGFNFKSLTSLATSNSPISTYSYTPANHRVEGKEQWESNMSIISNYIVNRRTNLIDSISSGAYGGTVYSYDVTNKLFVDATSPYNEDMVLATDSSTNTQYTNTSGAIVYYPVASGYDIDIQEQVENQSLLRQQNIQRIRQVDMDITIPGDSSVRVGEVINVVIPSAENIKKELFIDNMSGKYIIVSMRHIIKHNEYKIVLNISKDGFK